MIPGAPPAAPGSAPVPPPMPVQHPPMAANPMGGQAAPPQAAPPQPPAPPPMMVFDQGSFDAAVQLLRDDKLRGFRVDIETQSTIAADQTAERADASQMVQAVGAFMQSSLPMLQAMPAMTPLVGKLLLFLLRRFGVGVELEGAFEDAISKLEGNPGANPMQNPKAEEAQGKQQMLQMEMQSKQQDLQAKQQLAQQKMQQDAADHQMDLQGRQMESQADAMKASAEMKKALLDEQMARADHDRAMQQGAMEHQNAMAQAAVPLAPQKLAFGAGVLTKGTK